nr:uncharacterized protein CTRU02_06052 [Colletotrichum truncatum]KAF6793180.1 hypothetical protein CTRU02_06052 [Colletotrichum truncatum]
MHFKSDTPLVAFETRESEEVENWPGPAFADVQRQRRHTSLIQAAAVLLCIVFSSVAYYLGYQHGLQQAPQLPTHSITNEGFRLTLRTLDDEFDVQNPTNLKFKGQPRPELDEAWDGLLKGMNIRVHSSEAKQANFTSIELADSSGDVFAMPAVFHNLHCLKTIRHYLFPKSYPEDWEYLKPSAPGEISPHMDHCIDNTNVSW